MYVMSEVTLRPSVVVALRDTDQRVTGHRYPFPGKGVRVLVPARYRVLVPTLQALPWPAGRAAPWGKAGTLLSSYRRFQGR